MKKPQPILWDLLNENLRQLDGFVRVVIQNGVQERQDRLRELDYAIEHIRSVLEQHREKMEALLPKPKRRRHK